RAPTRSASALFQVKRGSSKLPLTCNTKTSFSSFLACLAAADGLSANSTLVPKLPQDFSAFFSTSGDGGRPGRGCGSEAQTTPSPSSGVSKAALLSVRRRIDVPPWGLAPPLTTRASHGLRGREAVHLF